jgi:hypothetical protein
MKSTDPTRQQLTALRELHRPLEEHWLGIKSKYSLDPNGSDMVYKHHMARLEEIYLNKAPIADLTTTSEKDVYKKSFTPVAQLFGINGE